MKTKTIPFDLETAKKIQAGEIEGSIKTIDGEKARILCFDVKGNYPMAVAITKRVSEELCRHRLDGKYIGVDDSSHYDLVLEVPDNEPQFKPFDRVLVRTDYHSRWIPAVFQLYQETGIRNYYASGDWYLQCIPYAGNEHLLGTTNNPKEE